MFTAIAADNVLPPDANVGRTTDSAIHAVIVQVVAVKISTANSYIVTYHYTCSCKQYNIITLKSV
jgi:hypothetical protein